MTTHHAMRRARIGLPLLAIAALTAACGTSSPSTQSHQTASVTGSARSGGTSLQVSKGHLVDGGRTVYLWVADISTTSHCTGPCASVWPPVTVTGKPTPGAGLTPAKLSTIKRSDGTTQLAYAGHPLYYFAADTAPGDTKGQGSDGFGARWWELNSTGQPITTAATTPTSPSTTPSSGAYGY